MDTFEILSIVNKTAQKDTIRAFLHVLSEYHPYTFLHSIHVAILSAQIAAELNFSEEDIRNLTEGAMLHDIGKLSVPLSILDKPSSLSDEEFDVIREHPFASYKMSCKLPMNKTARKICYFHHKFLDGSGYPAIVPERFGDNYLDWAVQIVTVSDIFSAITSPRSYAQSESPRAALDELFSLVAENKINKTYVKTLETLVTEQRIIINTSTVALENNSSQTDERKCC